MLKPALFALTGAAVTVSAVFSEASPALLAATQLAIYAVVYLARKGVGVPAQLDHYHGYVSAGTFLFASKLLEYWTLCLAGPLASQGAFLPIPAVMAWVSHAFPSETKYKLTFRDSLMMAALALAVPVFAAVRPEPAPLGILTAFGAMLASGLYAAFSGAMLDGYTDKTLPDVRAAIYAHAAILAAIVCVFATRTRPNLVFICFALSCAAHAIVRRWYDVTDGSKNERMPGEWRSARALLTLTWAWLHEFWGVMVAFAVAAAVHAYFFRSRRERASAPPSKAMSLDETIAVEP